MALLPHLGDFAVNLDHRRDTVLKPAEKFPGLGQGGLKRLRGFAVQQSLQSYNFV